MTAYKEVTPERYFEEGADYRILKQEGRWKGTLVLITAVQCIGMLILALAIGILVGILCSL